MNSHQASIYLNFRHKNSYRIIRGFLKNSLFARANISYDTYLFSVYSMIQSILKNIKLNFGIVSDIRYWYDKLIY